MKNLRKAASMAAAVMLLTTGVVAAQTSNAISVSSSPQTTSISPGTQSANLGTFQFSGGPSGTSQITSIPLTLTTSGGATASDLSNCQIISNATGQAITANMNSLQSGSNTFNFSSPLSFTGGSTAAFTVRCNIASNASTGGLYQFNAGTPVLASGLRVGFVATPNVSAGAQGTILGLVTLDASNSSSPIRVTSLPLSTTFSGGASALNLQSCTLRNVGAITVPVTTGGNVVSSINNATTFTFDTPVTVAAGGSQSFVIACNVNSATPVGSMYSMTLTPSQVAATDANGATVSPTALLGTNGSPLSTSGIVTVQAPTGGTGGGSTPGVPNTGEGGAAEMNLVLLGLAVLAAGLGAGYVLRTRVE